MSIALVEVWREKQRVKWIVKFLLRRVAQPCVLVVLAYVFPKMAIFYAICGPLRCQPQSRERDNSLLSLSLETTRQRKPRAQGPGL